MYGRIHREITPLKENDCFLVFDRMKTEFNYPVHFHPEFEINFIINANGAKRIVGDHISEISEKELIMVGPNLYHGWINYHNRASQQINEITIQFPRDLFGNEMLNKNVLSSINELLTNAQRGILFSENTIDLVESRIRSLGKKNGFDSFLELQSLLYDLALSRDQKLLTNISFRRNSDFHNSEKIEKVYNYIKENYQHKIMLENAAEFLNMSVVTFSRFIKQRTGNSFINFLNEIRLGYATQQLIDTNKGISEICFDCGFNNISNFNRTFKKKQGITPSEFRENFKGLKNVF
ncbi:MAG TPA: AraC family transcriptional regulator [Bacteroidales bacterium]|nr:AraC family transcriptional regulator [Bacteroidales bacterium]